MIPFGTFQIGLAHGVPPPGVPQVREVIPAGGRPHVISAEAMKRTYDEVKTPFKYGVILKGDKANELVDCASIFRSGQAWYMMYIASVNEQGYQTYLARSFDLLHWEKLGRIFSFTKSGNWDAWQADAGIALCDPNWEGTHRLEKFHGKYWVSYIGGSQQGYEPDPLSIGVATSDDPTAVREWTRIQSNPVLTPNQIDTRPFEAKTLYKSQIIRDRQKSLGWPFVMFYNGKFKDGYERIGMAVSRDMVNWSRYGAEPVIANGEDQQSGISGDPQIVKMGDLWVMFYFGAFWKPGAFDTFACSYDLVHWTKWTGPHLVSSSEPFDATYAHKPWVIKWKGVVYHFYCAVGNEGRVLAVATSKDLKASR